MKGKARIIEADRSQPSWDVIDLEAWLPADHRARTVWAFTGTLDLSPLHVAIKSVEGEAGPPGHRSAGFADALVYATASGIGSARELERLCGRCSAQLSYPGGFPRLGRPLILDKRLTDSLTALRAGSPPPPEQWKRAPARTFACYGPCRRPPRDDLRFVNTFLLTDFRSTFRLQAHCILPHRLVWTLDRS